MLRFDCTSTREKQRKNPKRRSRERERDEKKKTVKELNKAALKKQIGREVTDEDENYGDNNNDAAAAAVVFFREDREKNKQTRNRHMYGK